MYINKFDATIIENLSKKHILVFYMIKASIEQILLPKTIRM